MSDGKAIVIAFFILVLSVIVILVMINPSHPLIGFLFSLLPYLVIIALIVVAILIILKR